MKKLGFIRLIAVLCLFFSVVPIQAKAPEAYTRQDVVNVDFGSGANFFTIEAASAGFGGELELRIDAADGAVIGHVFFHQTGDSDYFLPYECDLNETISGVHDVYMSFQDYADPFLGRELHIGDFKFTLKETPPETEEGDLHVYPPVPGLDPSPYYEFRVQKVSELNAENLTDVTNWETPFAWFTQSPLNGTPGYGYAKYIGGWSHTYTNFELDASTPVVIKISRKDNTGDDAPSGPIKMAAVHPAHRVDSWELIDGNVYVTMSKPAQITVDIDGQMDTRDAPRAKTGSWSSDAFPYKNKKDGAHAVSVFANPFIEDKPNPDDEGVLLIKAGEKIPDNLDKLSWTTLYFEPGVHRTCVDVDGDGNLVERRWIPEDVIPLMSNRNYYIPGNAIVYGNFTNHFVDDEAENIRVYGHGTISGEKILHFGSWTDYPENVYPNSQWHRGLLIEGAENCTYEGITMADPANHTFTMSSSTSKEFPPNTLKWAKLIAWRPNSDATAVGGHSSVEDCFLRTQDDGHYTGGTKTMRRVVFWHDVNGLTFRGSFMNDRVKEDYHPSLPRILLAEDIDVIYARGVFHTYNRGRSDGIIGVNGGRKNNKVPGGAENTGQMIVFRNIRLSDPRPTRSLVGMESKDKIGDYAGLRFINCEVTAPHTFGGKSGLVGGPDSHIRNFVFDNVIIAGEQVDNNYLNNPNKFETDLVFDMTFRLRDTISSTGNVLTTTVTNGTITVEETGTSGEVTLSVSASDGYEFNGWSGDLTGSENPVTISVDRDMAITASIDVFKYDLTTTSENGTIVLDPPSASYLPGTVVTVTTLGDLGYGFESWGGDLSGTSSTETITMDGDKTISANFTPIVTYELDVDTKYGTVVLNPPGGTYNDGVQVSLTTNPDLGYIFGEWSGDLSGSQSSKTITMDADKTVSAKFLYAGAGGSSDVAINCKGSQYTSADNVVYEPSDIGSKYATSQPISGTEDDELYQSEAFGASLSYNFALNNGPYEVVLKFAEIFHGASGKRLFDVSIEDEVVLDDFDIVAEAGGKNIALDKTFLITVLDQELNITLSKVLDNAKISAIQIISQSVEVESFTLEVSAPQNGSITIDPVEDTYPAGSEVTLEAVAETGFAFVGWSGDYTGFDNPTDLYMDDNKSVTALFDEAQTYTLTSHITNGEISLSPEGGIYNQLTEVVVSVSPEEGYKFAGWQGDLSGTDNPATIVMSGDKDVTALIVEIPTYTLSIVGENGNVSIDPLKETYIEGEQVTITATADEGYRFEAWSGDYAGSLNPATITIDENKSIRAVFEEIPIYTLTTVAANGSITLDPSGGTYEEGTSVSISLSVDEGYRFVGWSGNLSGTQNPVTLVMNGDKEVTAQIEEIPSYTLTIAGENGAVSIDPQKDEYEEGEQVTISASADEGYRFGAWSGDLTGSQNPATIMMNADKSITAKFNMIPVYTLTTTAPNGTITLDPEGGSYQEGTSVTLTLSIDEGYEFVGWLGDYSGMDNPVSIVMNENKTITAAIVEIPSYTLVLSGENGSVSVDPLKESYLEDEQVTISATADEGYKFTAWSGALTGTENPASVVMDGNKLITAVFELISGAEDILANAKQSCLLQNYPNPFYGFTTIPYHLSQSEHVRISIHNLTGQEVVVLVDKEERSGKHELIWDAQQSYGKAVPQGLYICRFEAGGIVQTTKVILAK